MDYMYNDEITRNWCDAPKSVKKRNRNSRREFLQVGALTGLGLSLGDMLKLEARADQKHYESKEGKAKSVIHIFLPGGMAHQESWDPHPYAPIEYRGPYGTVKTNTGEYFSQNMI